MIRILIVEDEITIARLIDLNLSACGYECTCEYDGLAAADLLEQMSFDLILLDIMLPGADGFELMDLIRPTKTPVIFLTARGSVSDRVNGLRAGAMRVTRGAEPVLLTPKEFDLLLLFVQNRNIALFRETIYERVWGTEFTGDSRTVDLHVQRLRRKLGWQGKLLTIYKTGYRLEVTD